MAKRRRDNGSGTIWYEEERKRWLGRIVLAGKATKVSGRTKAEVSAKLKALSEAPVPTGYTVRQAFDEFMAVRILPLCRKSTHDQYESLMRIHVMPAIGDMAVEDVLPKHVQSVIAAMAMKGRASKTMKDARVVIHAFFAWLEDNETLSSNPCRKIKIPMTETAPRRSLSSSELPAFFDALERSRWRHSVRFLLLTGLRRGELLALRWEDISDSWLSVSRTRSVDGVEGPPKSQAGQRRIRIGKAVQAVLDSQAEMLRLEGVISPYVFPKHDGDPVQPSTYYNTIKRHAAAAGIRISVHELRHTFVSIAGRAMDLKTLQAVLGHASSTQTLDLYQHLLDESLQLAAGVVDRAAGRMDAAAAKSKKIFVPRIVPRGEKVASGEK